MRSLVGPHWTANPVDETKLEMKGLNTTTLDKVQRLKQLRTDTIGGILLVTQVVDDKDGKEIPFLSTILAAPSVTTFNENTGDVGVILDDIWESSVLQAFHPDLDTSAVHCPIVGAQEGFSCSSSFKANVVGILQDAQPLFIPEGKLVCTNILKENVSYQRAILLPEVCNMPIGICWPVNIGFPDFLASLQAILGISGNTFKQAIL
jgi:hypothetical protein